METEQLHPNRTNFAPGKGFTYRRQLERELMAHIKQHGEPWPISLGLYNSYEHSLVNHLGLPPHLYDRTPATFHDGLGQFIEDLIETKPATEPIVVLDMGGGAGSTWRETAKCFEKEVLSGKVVFVLSNLAWSPERFISSDQNLPGSGLVANVSAAFRKLCSQSITLPSGQNLSLRRNVDLVHESQSLTRWSQVPELDMLSICGLLSPYGLYFVAHPGVPCKYNLVEDPKENLIYRQAAVNQTQSLLQSRYGMKRVLEVESGEYAGATLLYSVFKKTQAPKIRV